VLLRYCKQGKKGRGLALLFKVTYFREKKKGLSLKERRKRIFFNSRKKENFMIFNHNQALRSITGELPISNNSE
jgi:hypothetical protein